MVKNSGSRNVHHPELCMWQTGDTPTPPVRMAEVHTVPLTLLSTQGVGAMGTWWYYAHWHHSSQQHKFSVC